MAAIDRDVTSLLHMTTIYDSGHTGIAGDMATVVEKIFVANRTAAEDRGTRAFPSLHHDDSPSNLMPYHHSTGMVIGGDPVTVSFYPLFAMTLQRPQHQKFTVWWESEPIYRAGAGKPGTLDGMIPLKAEDQIPYSDREKFTRRSFVNDLRNAIGSHTSDSIPALLHDLYQVGAFGAWWSRGESNP
jgi:hypothetical protein